MTLTKRAGNGEYNGHNISDRMNVQAIPESTEAELTCQSEPDEVSVCLSHFELDASFWAVLLKGKLGVETVEALGDVGWHLLPFLVQFARKPEEKKALINLFWINTVILLEKACSQKNGYHHCLKYNYKPS